MVGGFASNGHVKHDCLPEIIRIIKPGNIFLSSLNTVMIKIKIMQYFSKQQLWAPLTFRDGSPFIMIFIKIVKNNCDLIIRVALALYQKSKIFTFGSIAKKI